MNTRKTVYNKLFTEKTELSTHEIELADFAAIKTQLDKAETEYNKVLDYTNRINAIKQEAKKNTSIDALPRIIAELTSDKDNFIVKVKALGIDETKIPQPKQYADAINRIEALSNKAKQYITDFQK
jgi:glycyl-tRNA synthetase alpha subunit